MRIKNILTILIAAIICKSSAAQFEGSKQVYSSPKLKAEIPTHKTVAILPFNATISYKRLPKNFDEAANKADQNSMAANLQQGMYLPPSQSNRIYCKLSGCGKDKCAIEAKRFVRQA